MTEQQFFESSLTKTDPDILAAVKSGVYPVYN